MNKFLMLGAAAISLGIAAPAYAEHHDGKDHHKKGAMFEKHDTDGNGAISRDEFLTHATQKAEEKFVKLDSDGNGSVSKEEMAAARKKWKEKRGDFREKMREKMEDKAKEKPPEDSE